MGPDPQSSDLEEAFRLEVFKMLQRGAREVCLLYTSFSTGMAILSTAYPPDKRGRALGYNVAVTYLGLSMGPVLGGVMNHYFGWRSIFYLTTLLGLMASLGIQFRLQEELSLIHI